MSVLPSPVPHPFEFSPFDVPGWAYEALEWVVGFDWPAGNEVATWDVADRWYLLAASLADPNEAAMAAANKFLSGYGGEGVTAEGFEDAWRMVAGDENAPLHDLLRVSDELGRLVESTGTDIEAAKLEAWIEIGIFLIELVGMAVTVTLTLGAASPAAGGLIVATRLAIQRIFRRLVEQLGTKALKQTAGRAVKQITTRQGLSRLGREALDEGFDEAREEIAVNGGIQLHQESTGRSHGFDWDSLGRNAVAGFAGGAASSGASLGSHGHGGVLRGAGGEVLAEFGAAATFGELPDAAGLAKSATSGAAGSAIHAAPSAIDIGHLELPDLPPPIASVALTETGLASPATSVVPLGEPFGGTPESAGRTSGAAPDASAPGPASSPTTNAGPSNSSAAAPTSIGSSPADTSNLPGEFDATSTPSPAASLSSAASPTPVPPSPTSLPPLPATPDHLPATPGQSSVLASVAFADPISSPLTSPLTAPAPDLSPSPTGNPLLGPYGIPFTAAGMRPTGTPGSPPPGSPRSAISDLDRIAEALGPRTLPSRPAHRYSDTLSTRPSPPTPSPRPEVRDEQAYFGYVEHARHTHEQNRRDEYAAYLDTIAEDNRAKIVDVGRRADEARRAGFTLREADYRRHALELSEIVAEIDAQIVQVRTGELAPDRVEVDPPAWSRINHDVGNLAPGGIRTGDLSALDGFGGRPPIDRTRHYNVVGGLRAPLAVHQIDLENAVPRDNRGQVSRLPDPRAGTWFRLANDGGPAADPTRGLNCVDGTLSLFDTYIHGRPRVSAPRTFDVYAHGNPDRPLGGETQGIQRIRLATGSDFQGLCPHLRDADPAAAKPAMDLAVQNLTNHLLNTGHGAYAFIVTDLEGGGSHSWSAVNHNGTVLFLDPQIGRISEHAPMYRHHGFPAPTNLVSLEALVVDANGSPAPLPHHGPGNWSATPPTGADPGPDRSAIESLTADQRTFLEDSLTSAEVKAQEVSRDLYAALASFSDFAPEDRPQLVDKEQRVKRLGSLARKFLTRLRSKGLSPESALASIKDRVRFSVLVSHRRYGESVRATLDALEDLGYRRAPLEIFWADHGRHNGLNVNLTAPDGFVLELQFPTEASLAVGHRTHAFYEQVRDATLAPEARVEAFLEVLHINKESGIYERPHGLELLNDLADGGGRIDTTLANWLKGKRALATAYREYLSTIGDSFEQVLRRCDLDLEDVPGTAELGLIND